MSKRPHRATSKEAHESVKDHKSEMYDKIRKALIVMRVGGTPEEIAKVAGLKPDQVWKRLPEMVELGLCFNTGQTRAQSSGRKAMVRQLVGINNTIPPAARTAKEAAAQNQYKQLSLIV